MALRDSFARFEPNNNVRGPQVLTVSGTAQMDDQENAVQQSEGPRPTPIPVPLMPAVTISLPLSEVSQSLADALTIPEISYQTVISNGNQVSVNLGNVSTSDMQQTLLTTSAEIPQAIAAAPMAIEHSPGVSFGYLLAGIHAWGDTEITAVVPEGTAAGDVVATTTEWMESNSGVFAYPLEKVHFNI